MKKKLMALLTAVVLVVATSASVFAASSVAADDVKVVGSDAKVVQEDGSDIADATNKALAQGINNGTKTVQDLNSSVSGATALSKVVYLSGNNGANVTLSISNLTSSCSNVRVMIYDAASNTWKVYTASSVDLANKTATFSGLPDGPMVVIADVASASGTTTKTTTSTTTSSPKTGVESSSTVLFAAAIAALGAAAVVSFKKKRV